MAHLRISYRLTEGPDEVLVTVAAGPGPDHLRPVGELRMHPAEFSAFDRLMHVGHGLERPAHTYELVEEPHG